MISRLVGDYDLLQMSIDGNVEIARSCEIILDHFDRDLPYHDLVALHFENSNLW